DLVSISTEGGGGTPIASFTPSVEDGLDIMVAEGGTGTGTVTISNVGDASLTFSFPDFTGAARRGAEVILSEDFEGTFPPADWNAEDVTGQCPWLSSDDYPMSGWLGGARGAAIDADDCGSSVSADASLITPAMDLSAATDTHLEFDFAYRHLSSTTLTLEASTDGGATWAELMAWTAN